MDFFSGIFYNLALHEFLFFNIVYIFLYIELILTLFFQHSNILTRASHHWCLASNIVLVCLMIRWKQDLARILSGVYTCILIDPYAAAKQSTWTPWLSLKLIENVPGYIGQTWLSENKKIQTMDCKYKIYRDIYFQESHGHCTCVLYGTLSQPSCCSPCQ